MSTKINTSYYGDIASFVDVSNTNSKVKRSNNNVWNLIDAGKYTGGAFDVSAAPWGVGRSAAASMFRFIACKDGTLYKPIVVCNLKSNTPLYLYDNASVSLDSGYDSSGYVSGASVNSWKWENMLYRTRANLTTAANSNELKSTINSADNVNDAHLSINYPIVYADYQVLRLAVTAVMYKPVGENIYRPCTMSDLKNNTVNAEYIVGFVGHIYCSETSTALGFHPTVGGGEIEIPDEFKDVYYTTNADAITQPFRAIRTFGWWGISNFSANASEIWGNRSYFTDYSEFNTLNNSWFMLANIMSGWSSVTSAQQVFDDVTYHYNYGTTSFASNYDNISAWEENHAISGDDAPSTFCWLDIDDHNYNSKSEAFYYAILHELAFIGFPVVDSVTNVTADIGDDEVYLPEFAYMVTTGRFKNGADSLDMINATWGDIFDDSMPEYDPTIDPDDPPTPPTPPDPDDDYGYLNNKPTTNRVYSSNNRVYALTASQYSQFIKDINSLYLDDPQGFDNFQLDFKGTNPTDYIVGTFGYTFLPAGLIPNQQPENIEIGAVTLPNTEGYRIAPSYIYNYISLGEIDLTGAGNYKPFGDFRDYAPYTHIELYVPLCGNIELDPASVVGHTIQIDIRFDIMTGNASACVYRDNQTLIATIAGQLAASLPLSSGRMGDYQNAVKSAENALKQNELKTMTAAATVAIGVGAALLAPETGGLSLAAYGAAITGGASLMSLSNQKNQIEYEIEHKQPSISVCSAANGAVAQNISSMYAVCYVKQCKMLATYNAATYAHTVGHATIKNTTISAECTEGGNSLIVCSNADLSGIPATAAEISAIQSLLTGGIYV